ncbi:MAG: hypothetical protein ACFE9R_01235 [Candidatus Hermodarchaeota archaeon]
MAKKIIKINLPIINSSEIQQAQLQPVLVQNIPFFRRHWHHRVDADVQLLEPKVSKIYFKKTVKELREKCTVYQDIWKIKEIFYPYIFIDVYSTKGKNLYVLSLNLRNYNYSPPQIGLLTPDEKLIMKVKNSAINKGEFEINHIIPHNNGVWMCTPGTYKYHDFYFDIDRWEKVRYDLSTNIIELINRIIGMINRNKDDIIEIAK